MTPALRRSAVGLVVLFLAGLLHAQSGVEPSGSAVAMPVAGAGFGGVTAQPAAVGDSAAAGYSEFPIARWDVVPYQTFGGTLRIGVIAFHLEGVRSVAFSVNGGEWSHASKMVANPDTGAVEYCADLKASDYKDGLIEVRALVIPVSGKIRVLQGSDYATQNASLFVYANSGGTLNPTYLYCDGASGNDANNGALATPVRTLDKALDLVNASRHPVIVQIQSGGNYAITTPRTSPRYASNYNYPHWTTIQGAPSLPESAVVLVGGGRGHINHLRIYHLTEDNHAFTLWPEPGFQLWADHVAFTNSVGWTEKKDDPPVRYYQSGGTYQTDCTYTNMFRGPLQATIIRDATCTRISEDLINNADLVVNLTASNLRGAVKGTHNDGAQYFGVQANKILYGVNITDASSYQGIFFDHQESSFDGVAIVNYRFETIDGHGPPFSQFCSAEKNFYISNLNIPVQTLLLRTDMRPDGHGGGIPFRATHWKIVNSTVSNATIMHANFRNPPAGVTISGVSGSGR